MPEMHLKQIRFTYSAYGLFTKNKERIEKFMNTRNIDFIYKNDLAKACFQHEMSYGKSKYLAKRTQPDKVSRDKYLEIASNPDYDGYQRGLASVVYKFSDRTSAGSDDAIKSVANYQLVNELHRCIIRTFKRRKLYSLFKDSM